MVPMCSGFYVILQGSVIISLRLRPTHHGVWPVAGGFPVSFQEVIASELKPMLSQNWCDTRLDLQVDLAPDHRFRDR